MILNDDEGLAFLDTSISYILKANWEDAADGYLVWYYYYGIFTM